MNLNVIIFLALTVSAALLLVRLYNGFIAKRNIVRESLGGIDIMFKKRADLIPNLVDTVKSYSEFEKGTLDGIVQLRNKAAAAHTTYEKNQIDKSLSVEVGKIFALVENYPDLKASTNYLQLQNELVNVETDIERSKRYYNGAVREYNTAIESFPGNIVARSFGFQVEEFLALNDADERETASISF